MGILLPLRRGGLRAEQIEQLHRLKDAVAPLGLLRQALQTRERGAGPRRLREHGKAVPLLHTPPHPPGVQPQPHGGAGGGKALPGRLRVHRHQDPPQIAADLKGADLPGVGEQINAPGPHQARLVLGQLRRGPSPLAEKGLKVEGLPPRRNRPQVLSFPAGQGEPADPDAGHAVAPAGQAGGLREQIFLEHRLYHTLSNHVRSACARGFSFEKTA